MLRAIVLAAGESRRMGQPKAGLAVTPGGPSFAAAAVAALRAAGPSQAVLGGIASVVASWTAPTGKRSLGVVRLSQTGSPTVLSSTAVFVDNATPTPELAAAPVLREKTALK